MKNNIYYIPHNIEIRQTLPAALKFEEKEGKIRHIVIETRMYNGEIAQTGSVMPLTEKV